MAQRTKAPPMEEDEMRQLGSLKLLNASTTKSTPTSPSKKLMHVDVVVNGRATKALVDTGATHNFVTEGEAKRLGLQVTMGDNWVKSVNATARPLKGMARGVELSVGTWRDK